MADRKMSICFVIQEFDDGGTFDRRYKDVIAPAIQSAKAKPLRADDILGLNPIIEKIEKAIQDSDICIAEVSTDNPNVWMELGYALALSKPTIIICDKGKRNKLPFDVQHRPVIFYSSESPSDFDELGKKLKTFILNELVGNLPVPSDSEGQVTVGIQENLKVMCWESRRWNIYPLEKMVIDKSDRSKLSITNSTYIHKFALIIFDKILKGDFKSTIYIEGLYRTIQLNMANGEDRTFSITPPDQGISIHIPHKIEISRVGTKLSFSIDGKRLYHNNWRAVGMEVMECYISIALHNDRNVIIHKWIVEQ